MGSNSAASSARKTGTCPTRANEFIEATVEPRPGACLAAAGTITCRRAFGGAGAAVTVMGATVWVAHHGFAVRFHALIITVPAKTVDARVLSGQKATSARPPEI